VLVQPTGGTLPVVVPALEPALLVVSSRAPVSSDAPVAAAGSAWNTQRVVGLTIGAAGAVTMIVGAVFGLKAAGKNTDSFPHCLANDITTCDPEGIQLRDDAFTAAEKSSVLFGVGGGLIGIGAITFLTAPSAAPKVQPVVGAGYAGLTLRGAW
jgi:hypothetical protein